MRFIVSIALGALVLAAGPACAPAGAQDFTLRLATIFPDTHPIGRGASALKAYVERESNGRVRIQIFPNSQLGGLRSIEDSAAGGLLDIAQAAAPTLQTIYKPAAVLALPYAFRDGAHLEATWAGPVGETMRRQIAEQVKLHILATFPQPPREMTAKKAIQTVADVKGLKIRVPDVPTWVAFWKKIGAIPTPIDLSEIVTSLQVGMVDAQENPVATIQSLKLADVQKFVILTGHVRTLDWLVLSDATYRKLPEDLRAIVLKGGREAEKATREAWATLGEEARKSLTAAGMTFIEPNVASFIAAQQGLYKEFLTPELQKLYEDIQAVK